MVVFGGGANGGAYKDAAGLMLPTGRRPAAWHSLSPTTALTARDQATVVVDDGVLTVFGGFGAGTLPGTVNAGTHLADTWQRQVDRRGRWHLATPADATRVPIAREGAAYALDEGGDRLLLFGGLTGDTTLADVWVADLSRPGRPRWQQVCSPASCGTGPSARWGAHAVLDARPSGWWSSVDSPQAGSRGATCGHSTWRASRRGVNSHPMARCQRPVGARRTASIQCAGGWSCSAARPVPTRPARRCRTRGRSRSTVDRAGPSCATVGQRPIARRSPAGAVRHHDGQRRAGRRDGLHAGDRSAP